MLRRLMEIAIDLGLRADDPTKDVRAIRIKSDGYATWSDADTHRETHSSCHLTTHQWGMVENCGTSSGFSHFSRRLVNISSIGLTSSGRSKLPRVTKIVPGKLSRLLVNTRAPQSGQKLRSSPLPDSAI